MSKDNFCKSQLITCNRVKECNGVCPFEDALKHADQTAEEQNKIDHDREWIIGCIKHDGFIHTDRFDKANQIILDALEPSGDLISRADAIEAVCGIGRTAISRQEVCNALSALPSADAVHGYTEWLEKIIVYNGANEWLCEDTPDMEWCDENCHYSSIQAECLRHLYEVSKGGDTE